MSFLADLKDFCERLRELSVWVNPDPKTVSVSFYWRDLLSNELLVQDGWYRYGWFERDNFMRVFSTRDLSLANKVMVLDHAPLVRYCLYYPSIEFPKERRRWPSHLEPELSEEDIECDFMGFTDKLSWVTDLSESELLAAYAAEDGGPLNRWLTDKESKPVDKSREEWRRTALRQR